MHPGDATPGPRDVNVLCERMGGRTRMAATQRCEFALTDKCNGSDMAASQTAAKAAQKGGGVRDATTTLSARLSGVCTFIASVAFAGAQLPNPPFTNGGFVPLDPSQCSSPPGSHSSPPSTIPLPQARAAQANPAGATVRNNNAKPITTKASECAVLATVVPSCQGGFSGVNENRRRDPWQARIGDAAGRRVTETSLRRACVIPPTTTGKASTSPGR